MKIRKIVAPLLSLAMYIVIILIFATTFSLVFDTGWYFWVITVAGILIMVLTNLIWFPNGADKGASLTKVKNNSAIYNHRANFIVENQMFKKLDDFCDKKNADFEVKLIKDKLSTVSLDYAVYERFKFYHDTKKEFEGDELKEKQEFEKYIEDLTKKQRKILNNIVEKGVKFEKLTPSSITIGRNIRKRLVAKNKEGGFKALLITGKAFWGILVACFTTFICFGDKFSLTTEQGIQIAMWGYSILHNIYSAYTNGYKSVAIYRNQYFIDQSVICAEFFEFAGVSMEEADKGLVLEEETTEIKGE